MVLYDEEESEKKKNIILTTIIIIIIITTLAFLGKLTYEQLQPIPQIEMCEVAGYEAGEVIGGKTYCYKECPTNKIVDCGYRRKA